MIVTKQLKLDSSGPNDTPQNSSALLELISTSQGLLPSRMTNAQMLAIPSPAIGLLVYQTDGVAGLYQYSGSAWVGFGSANDIAYEIWSTDANYTTLNTTSKRLIVIQTGTLSATRTLTLSNVPNIGQEVLIVAGGSVSATNKITVTCGNKINVTLNSFDIVGNYSQTLLTSVATNSWSTGQATPQFIETSTALTSTKIVRGLSIGIGNTRTWTTAGMGAGTAYGDIILTSAGILATGASGETSAVQMITPYDPSYGWTIYQTANTFLSYWAYGNIQAGTKPLEYTTNSVSAFYWGCTYSLEHYSSDGSNNQPFRAIIYIDDTGVPSILETLQSDGVTFYSVSAGKLLLSATSNRGYTTVKKIVPRSITQLPERYQKYSADGQTRYFTGTGGLGIGHTSQSTSAILQLDVTNKGFLPPRMTNAQMLAIASPATGLVVYQTDGIAGLYQYNGSTWTLTKSQFTETTTVLSTSKKLVGEVLGTGGVDGIPTLANAGDFQNSRLNFFAFGVAMNMRGVGTNFIKAYDAHTGWTQWANTGENPNLKHWNGQEITSGNIPTGSLGGNSAIQYQGYYSYEIHDRVSRHIRGYFYLNGSGVPSNLVQTKQESSGLSIAITGSPAKVVVTNASAIFARLVVLETQDSTTPNFPNLYESWSNDAQTQYWTGIGGIGSDNGFSVKTGTNRTAGLATLVAGTVTVSTTKVTANSMIFLTRQTISGTIGTSVDITARTPGTSFTITSNGSVLDTSAVAWQIIEPY